MDVRHEIDQLAEALLPPYEERAKWPHDAQDTTDRLFAVILGMYMANQLTSDQLKNLVSQHEDTKRTS